MRVPVLLVAPFAPEPDQYLNGLCYLRYGCGTGEKIQRSLDPGCLRPQQSLIDEWRKSRHFSFRKQRLRKGVIVMLPQRIIQRMIGEFGLNQHFSRDTARPARPATCINCANSRSDARKSVLNSEASEFKIPTSDKLGKSCPFARICVPIRISIRCS